MKKLCTVLFVLPMLGMVAGVQAQGNTGESSPDPIVHCSEFMYRILPGDFNFCVARKFWMKGKTEQAEEYLKLAAGWGSKAAQQALGVAYFNGDGLSKNRALGLAWLELSAERADPKARMLYESALHSATQGEQAQARGEFLSLRSVYADDVAAQRADVRYRRELYAMEHEMAGGSVYGRGACIEGMAQLANMRTSMMGFDDNMNPTNTCTMSSERHMLSVLEARYQVYFSGWKGTVTTGQAEAAAERPVR